MKWPPFRETATPLCGWGGSLGTRFGSISGEGSLWLLPAHAVFQNLPSSTTEHPQCSHIYNPSYTRSGRENLRARHGAFRRLFHPQHRHPAGERGDARGARERRAESRDVPTVCSPRIAVQGRGLLQSTSPHGSTTMQRATLPALPCQTSNHTCNFVLPLRRLFMSKVHRP